MERVQEERERVVLAKLGDVVTHLVRDPFAFRRRIEGACRHIEAGLVEEHPGVGPPASESTLVGKLLDEVGDGRDGSIDFFVELAVQPNLLGQPSGAYRGSALIVPGNHLRRDGHRRNDLGGGRGAQPEGKAESEIQGSQAERSGWCGRLGVATLCGSLHVVGWFDMAGKMGPSPVKLQAAPCHLHVYVTGRGCLLRDGVGERWRLGPGTGAEGRR